MEKLAVTEELDKLKERCEILERQLEEAQFVNFNSCNVPCIIPLMLWKRSCLMTNRLRLLAYANSYKFDSLNSSWS